MHLQTARLFRCAKYGKIAIFQFRTLSTMRAPHQLFNTLSEFPLGNGSVGRFYSLPALEAAGVGKISRLPVSIRIVLEAVLRNCDGKKITEQHIRELANWQPNGTRTEEIPFVVARILLQDFTGVPLLADLAAMRSAAAKVGKNPKVIEPLVPVDMVVDHSVQVDVFNQPDALQKNMELEFIRNRERYQFLKWGMQAFDTFKVVPPGIGIVHQVNLEYLARGVMEKDGVHYPDTLVGTDSHTTMINGLGIVAWGVGGIEAEAGMLGQPVYFLTPDVVGVHLKGKIREGVTATDVVLTVTEMLRKAKVVGKFVEFFGDGAAALSLPDRATIANMAPEYGATMGFFPVDEATCAYYAATGRSAEQVDTIRNYFQAQGLFGISQAGDCDYSQVLEIDLGSVVPSVAGPRRPQDRIELDHVKQTLCRTVRQTGGRRRLRQGSRDAGATCGAHPGPRRNGYFGRRYANQRHAASRWHRPGSDDRTRNGGQPPHPRPSCQQCCLHGGTKRHAWSRRRGDCSDYFLYQHLQPQRDAGRRFAGKESTGKRPDRIPSCQDLPRPRLARGDGISESRQSSRPVGRDGLQAGGLRLHHLYRQLRPVACRDRVRDYR